MEYEKKHIYNNLRVLLFTHPLALILLQPFIFGYVFMVSTFCLYMYAPQHLLFGLEGG